MADYTLQYTGAQLDEAIRKVQEGYADVTGATANESDVAAGKTFYAGTSGLKTGTHQCEAGLDTSDATATADDILSDKTAYGASGKLTGTIATNTFPMPIIVVSADGLITASVSNQKGYLPSSRTDRATKQLTTKAAATYTPAAQDQTIASGQYLTGDQTIQGDANLIPGNIKSGVSIFGVAGSYEGSSGGGSSTYNCEAVHVTDVSQLISFATATGTVKVWGYGLKSTSIYSNTLYAFCGDGYYTGSYMGKPSKTSATFSIGTDGTLTGVPSGLTDIDVIVTKGI